MTRSKTHLGRRAFTLGAGALAAAAIHPARAQTVLRFSHTDTAVGSRQTAAEAFAKMVAEYSGNRLQVQVFHSGQLANDPKAVEQLQLGGVDFTVSGTGTYATHQRPLNLTALPFLFETYEQGWRFYDDSAWLAGQFGQLPSKGFRVLSVWEAGFRSFTTKAELRGPDDAKGKRMRVFPNDMIRWIMEAIGFNPVVMPVTEVYLALQQGTVIGQENPVDTIFSQRFFEVAPHITLTQHVYSPLPMTVSEATWRRLNDAEKAAVTRAAKESAALSRKLVREAEDGQLREMAAKGAKIARPDIGPFRASVASVYDKAREAYGKELVDGLLAEAERIRQALPKTTG
jgi:tripartite ATP-independent transporter DctP family solute receptor